MVGVTLCAAGLLQILHRELIALPLLNGALGARLLPIAVAFAALTFTVRGIAGYVPAWRRTMNGEPFATLDVRYCSPFCLALALAIGVGFGILLL